MDSSDRHPFGIRPGGTSRDTEPASTGVPTVEQVADLLDELVEANGLLAAEVRLIVGSSAALSQTTVHRFSLLADRLAPGFRARVVLSELDPGLLLAGTSIWIARRRTRSGVSARAGARWSSGMSA